MSQPILLLFGAGPNIGQSVAQAFKFKGYRVALASRSLSSSSSTPDELHIPTDCSDTDAVLNAFRTVQQAWGVPHVVVYNAYRHYENSPTDPFEVSLDILKKSESINLFGAYTAAQEAVKGWKESSRDSNANIKPTFIYTGNCTNTAPIAQLMDLSVGKSGAATFIAIAAEAYKADEFRFYYADERLGDGTPMWTGLSGEGHAKLYTELVEAGGQRAWLQTFVTGEGYKKF